MSSDIDDSDRVLPVFVNELIVSGFLNGVVNLTFATALFSPDEESAEGKVKPDLVVTSRLRMDLMCAQQVYERLGAIIQANTKPARTTEH